LLEPGPAIAQNYPMIATLMIKLTHKATVNME